jgi:transcriptional regulator with XRE-family HTH domain
VDAEEAWAIGARAAMIRRRRGLSQDVVAGFAGITKQYLSLLETGQRGFNRRGLIEDLADALSCSVADLTGQPYPPPDRESARAKQVITQIEQGLNEATLDDVPDLRPRTLESLNGWVHSTAELRDTARYQPSGEDIGAVLIELQVHMATSTGRNRQHAAELAPAKVTSIADVRGSARVIAADSAPGSAVTGLGCTSLHDRCE